jgi:RNA polymerase sigma-70 factor (ECF subfamily)
VDTEAVLQETLLRVWQVAPRFVHDGRPDGLFRLGIRMARNLAVSEQRRARSQRYDETLDVEVDDTTFLTARAVPDPMLRGAILDCRGKLPPQPMRALDARLQSGGLEPDEVLAERLQMRKNTFLQNFTRARKLLADCLRARGIDLEAELA